MIVRGFKSVIWVATVGGAALACYMVSLQVATERAELAKVERQILAAKREIRSLQTELGTRGRLSQLEQWNAEVLALSAPSSAQFLPDEVKLARFERADPTLEERSAEVRLAALSTGDEVPAVAAAPRIVHAVAPAAASPVPAVHRASYVPARPAAIAAAPRQSESAPAAPKPAAAKAPAPKGDAAKPAGNADALAAKPSKPAPKSAQAKAPAKPPVKASAAVKPDVKQPAKGAALAKVDPKAPPKPAAAKPRASRIDGRLAAEIKSGVRTGEGSGGN